MNNGKNIKGITCAALLCAALMTDGFAASKVDYMNNPDNYTDIQGTGAEKSLSAAIRGGVVIGTTSTTVSPYKKITRAEMSAMLVRALGYNTSSDLSSFSDMDSSAWYYDEVAKAYGAGILQGDGNGTLRPDNTITRQEAAVLLYRCFKMEYQEHGVDKYTDRASIPSWGKEAIETCLSIGALNPDKYTLDLKQELTRAEFAAMLYSVVQQYETAKVSTFSADIDGSILVTDFFNKSNFEISGNMYLTDALEDKSGTLSGIYVGGTAYVFAGGELKLVGGTEIQRMVVNTSQESITIVTDDDSFVNDLVINSATDVTLEGNYGSVEIANSSAKVTTKQCYIQEFKSDSSQIIAQEGYDLVVDRFTKGEEVKEPTVKYTGNKVVGSISVSKYNPVKLQSLYKKTTQDFVKDLDFTVDGSTIVITGDITSNRIGTSTVMGYYVPLRLIISDIQGDFVVKINDTLFKDLDISNDGDAVYLNALIPFTSDYKTAKVTLSPLNSKDYSEVDLNLRLGSNAKFIK